MNEPKTLDRTPINPYWVGGGFLDYCVRQGWLIKEREGRSVRYFATAVGVTALKDFGIEIGLPRRSVASNEKPQGKRRRTRPAGG
jgi:hypothetical protein